MEVTKFGDDAAEVIEKELALWFVEMEVRILQYHLEVGPSHKVGVQVCDQSASESIFCINRKLPL